jgi:hypothetical protein
MYEEKSILLTHWEHVSQLRFFVRTASFPPGQKANRTGVSPAGEARDEISPGTWMRHLPNRRSWDCERLLEGPGFDGLPERELS